MSTKRILFLGRTDDRKEFDTSWSMVDKMKAYAGSSISYESCNIEDLVFTYDGQLLQITNGVTSQNLDEFDAIFLLGWFKIRMFEDIVMAVARYADRQGIKILNPEALHMRSRSKLSQYVIAAMHDLHATPFIFVADSRYAESALKTAGMSYPLIVKSTIASRGRDNYLVKTRQEFLDVFANQPELMFVVQTFVPNDGDYRLLVMGDTVRLGIHRKSASDSHINNTSQGGVATIIDLASLNPGMLADAVKISQLIRRDVTGVDMIIHQETGEYYLLEANNMPQLSTGSMVEEKMKILDGYLAEWLES